MVTEPTRITELASNVLNLFFTSNSTLVNKVQIIPGISDYEAVYIESKIVSEYDQEIPRSQTADNPVAP